ncbi:42511_t:CDS:1, partial [Gigaspora margarita]
PWKDLNYNLKLLSDSSDLIPKHITEFLPFLLPIAECKNTKAVGHAQENLLLLIATKFIFL